MTPIIVRLIVLVAIFASIFLLSQVVLGSYANRRAERGAINRRLELLRTGLSPETVASILRKNVPGRISDNAGPVERLYFKFQRKVAMAALSTDPRMILLICGAAFVGLTALILFLAWTAKFSVTAGVVQLVALIAFATTVMMPIMFISRIAERRRKRMEEQFPVALDVFTRALRAGHPVASAIDLLTQEMEDPLGSEFGMVSDEVAYGANLTDALSSLAERWDLDDIRMFVVSLSLQTETGGNLAEILSNLSAVIRDRAGLYMKVRALSSEGRMTGWMLTVLPVLTLLSMFVVNPSFYLEVATDPIFVPGFTGLVVLYSFGVYVIRRMIDLKV